MNLLKSSTWALPNKTDAEMSQCNKILTLAFCFSIALQAFGAQPRIVESGLSSQLQQPTVTAIHRDRKGILWIGTQQGLHRFDGASLTVFNSDRSNENWISDSDIKDIAEDNDGNLLVATSGGILLKYNPRTEFFDAIKQFDFGDKSSLVRLLVTKHGKIWLLSKDELILYEPKFEEDTDWVRNLNLRDTVGTPHDILEDKSGNLWVGGNLGLARVYLKNKNLVPITLDTLGLPKTADITALGINADGNLHIGTNTGHLVVWDVEASTALAQASVEEDSQILISQLLFYEDKLIIGTDSGLFASNDHLSFFINLSEKHGDLSNPDIYSLYSDGKYIWIGKLDGLDILSFAPFDLFNSNNSGISNLVLALEQDQDGRMWIGTFSGLYFYDTEARSHIRFNFNADSPTLVDQRITSMVTRKNELWVGFFQDGVIVVDTLTGKFHTPMMINGNKMAITKILARNDSENVWVATYDHGLFRITGADTHSYYESESLLEKTITLLFQSKTGIFFAISENKVYQHDPKTDQFNEIRFDFGLGEKRPIIYSFAQAYNDDILIGTKDYGLFIWPQKSQNENLFRLQQVVESGDLATSTFYGIEPDSEGNLWCSTQNGIVKLDSRGQLIKRFTTAEGLQGNDFTFGAAFTSREGLIYFGGVNGYNRFDPREVTIDSSASPMRLTGITLPKQDDRNTGSVDELKTLQLTHKDHFVTFQFSVLDFVHPEGNQYRYRLENFDPDWIDIGTRNTATYTNLPSGEYVFRVQGANSAGIWNRDGITLNVSVLPAPWLTWWAISIYGIGLLFFWWGAYRIYHSYVADRKSAQMAMDMFESENRANDDMQEQLELQDELVQSAYQHNQTTLSLVGDCISYRSINQSDQVKRDLTGSSVKRIAALSSLEDCLYYQAGGLFANLKQYTDIIIPVLLKSSPVKSETIISINEVSATLLPADLASPLSIVIYELLENCIQHAFQLESPANYIHITMVPGATCGHESRHLELSVRDSGIGLPDSVEILAYENSGIAIVQSIVMKLGGTLDFSATKGTTVSMTIPTLDNL